MKDLIQIVINSGDFNLDELTTKIDKLWIEGKLTDDERDELTEAAKKAANPDNSLPGTDTRISALETRVAALETAVAALSAGTETETKAEWPEWVKPTSKDKYAKYGDGYTYEGKHYLYISKTGAGSAFQPTLYKNAWHEVTDLTLTMADALAAYEAELSAFFDGKRKEKTMRDPEKEFENGKGSDTPTDAGTPEAPQEGE